MLRGIDSIQTLLSVGGTANCYNFIPFPYELPSHCPTIRVCDPGGRSRRGAVTRIYFALGDITMRNSALLRSPKSAEIARVLLLVTIQGRAFAGTRLQQQNLFFEIPGLDDQTRSQLVNPWGIASVRDHENFGCLTTTQDPHNGLITAEGALPAPQIISRSKFPHPRMQIRLRSKGVVVNSTSGSVVSEGNPPRSCSAARGWDISGLERAAGASAANR